MWACVSRIAPTSADVKPRLRRDVSTSSRLPGKPASISITPEPSATIVQLTSSVLARCTVAVTAVNTGAMSAV